MQYLNTSIFTRNKKQIYHLLQVCWKKKIIWIPKQTMGNCQYFHSTQIASKNLAPFCVLYRKTGNEVVQKSYVSCELHQSISQMWFEIKRAVWYQKQSIYNGIFIFTIYETKVNLKKNIYILFFYRLISATSTKDFLK